MVSEELKVIKERIKLEKGQLATKKFEVKQKEKKGKAWTQFKKKLQKKVKSKRILKQGQMSVHIPEFKAPSILGDPNRFFKNEWEETKRSMFL